MAGIKQFSRAHEFAVYLSDSNILSTEDLLFHLAIDMTGQREYFSDLFDRLDWVPNAEEMESEAQDLLKRILRDKKQANALKAAKINKRPSQMTEEEKQAVRSISIINPKITK